MTEEKTTDAYEAPAMTVIGPLEELTQGGPIPTASDTLEGISAV